MPPRVSYTCSKMCCPPGVPQCVPPTLPPTCTNHVYHPLVPPMCTTLVHPPHVPSTFTSHVHLLCVYLTCITPRFPHVWLSTFLPRASLLNASLPTCAPHISIGFYLLAPCCVSFTSTPLPVAPKCNFGSTTALCHRAELGTVRGVEPGAWGRE